MIGSLNLSDLNIDNSNLSPNSSISDTSNINTNDVEEYNLELEQSNKKDLFKTIQFGFNSTLEGAFSVGENLRDLVELYGTDGMGKIMMKVGYIDEEIYNEMMEETKANVAINYVKESADVINENQGLTGNVYAEDSVREIGNGLGKTGEILALSLVGGYLAEVAGTSAGAAAATTASNASKVSRWAIAGFSGMGEELQIAFQNGATLEQGKKASYVKGIWDAFQWMVGDKINGLNPFNSGLKNAALHVGLDSLDSGAEGLVQPAIQKIYDERNYSEIFKENGGWSSVATQAIVGGAFSAGSEIFGNIKLKKPNNISSNTKQSISISSEKLYENSSMFNVKKIKNLSFDEQKKFLENCNIDIISKLFRDENFDLKPYKEIIDNKIIKNQDYIGNMCTALYDENLIKYIESNQNIIEKLSDRSLMRLAGKSNKEDHFIYTETILNEIEKRLKNNNFDLSFCSYRLENPSTRVKYDDYQIAMKLLMRKNPNYVNEVLDKLRLDWKKNIPVEVYSKINLIGYNQKAMLSKLFDSNQIDNTGIKLLDKIYEKNPNALNNFDFRALDKDFLKAVGEDYALEIGAYPEIMDKLLIIKEKSPVSYEKFINIINDAQKDVSLNNLYSKTSNVLNFLFNNSENIDDLVNLPNDTIINYVFLNENISKKYDINLDEDYLENFYKICDKEFNENILLEGSFFLGEAKDSYFKKYFSIDKIRVEKMIDKYGKHLDEILDKIDNEEGKRAAETLQALMNVYDNKSKSFLENLYKNNNGGIYLSGPEINYIEEILSNEYAKTYVDELIKTHESINSNIYKKVVVDGKIVDVSKIDDNFSLLVYSSDTGFKGEKSLVNDSFIQTWNQTGDLKTHGLSTSFISDKNIGSAPVGNNGVLYGFTKLKSQSIKEMGPYDLHSSISEYGFNSLNNQVFISADSMSKNTTRVYNELVVDRNAVQPNCVILYSDASEQVKINSYKAASEWGIPVVEIDIETLASKQLSKIDNLIKNFDNTGDASNLKEALELYESNISGYKLNSIDNAKDVTGGIDHSIVTNKFDSKKLEITFLEYIDKIKSSNNMQKISELEDIFESVLNKYEIANTNGTFDISKTKSFIDINTLLSVLKDGVVNE